jgi:hypothetical protein
MNILQTMRAMVLTGHGGLHKLEYREEWPTPQPGSGEVLVRVLMSVLLRPQAQEVFMLKKHIGNIVVET